MNNLISIRIFFNYLIIRFSANHRMQSTYQRSTTERQVTQRISNSVQRQSNFLNNQSIIQQVIICIDIVI